MCKLSLIKQETEWNEWFWYNVQFKKNIYTPPPLSRMEGTSALDPQPLWNFHEPITTICYKWSREKSNELAVNKRSSMETIKIL